MKRRYALAIGLWAILCSLHFALRTWAIVSGPHDEPEEYVYFWSFQGIVFVLFRFPFWLLGLAGGLLLMRLYQSKPDRPNERKTLSP